jgi:uncharacterized protein (DUF2249 family)
MGLKEEQTGDAVNQLNEIKKKKKKKSISNFYRTCCDKTSRFLKMKDNS